MGVWSLETSADTVGDTTIFAGSSSGVYSTTDWGENWEVTGLSSTTMPVHSIIIFDHYIYAATFSEGLFISQDNGLTWKNIIIKFWDETLPEMYAPICSIAIFVGPFSTNIIAGSYGGLYYMDYEKPSISSKTIANSTTPIFCFANRNDTLFTVQYGYGYLFGLYYDFFELKSDRLNIPYLENPSVYSLALNNGYIFAGTNIGIWRLRYPEAITGVESSREVPAEFVLKQNYPNPFNPTTVVTYQLPAVSNVKLIVYDLLGRPVATLVNERQAAGRHSVKFDAGGLPSGVYFYRLQAGSFVSTKKMILLQ